MKVLMNHTDDYSFQITCFKTTFGMPSFKVSATSTHNRSHTVVPCTG